MSRLAVRTPVALAVTGRRSLSDLLWVANTRHGPAAHWFARAGADEPDHDHLTETADVVRYLVDHTVDIPDGEPTSRQLAELGAISDMVRCLPSASDWTEAAIAIRAKARYRFADDDRLVADAAGWDGFIADLLLPLAELIRSRSRLSMCANPACRLVFLDDSKSHTRRWCDDAGCGNRARLGRHRRRLAGSAA